MGIRRLVIGNAVFTVLGIACVVVALRAELPGWLAQLCLALGIGFFLSGVWDLVRWLLATWRGARPAGTPEDPP